jgi:hypothetical protein
LLDPCQSNGLLLISGILFNEKVVYFSINIYNIVNVSFKVFLSEIQPLSFFSLSEGQYNKLMYFSQICIPG